MEKKSCKWRVFSMNIYNDSDLEEWLQKLGEEYSFYQLKLYEDKSARIICQDYR